MKINWVTTFFLILLFGLTPFSTSADESLLRTIRLEFEFDGGVSQYEIEIRSDKVLNFVPIQQKTSETEWKGKLAPGEYQVRTRSFDERGIAGEWSEFTPLKVLGKLDPPQIVETDLVEVQKLEWKASEDAQTYSFTLEGEVANRPWQKLMEKTSSSQKLISFKRKLSPGKYELKVRAEGSPWRPSDYAKYSFVIPEIKREPAFVPDLSSNAQIKRDWSHSFLATYLITGIHYSSLNNQAVNNPSGSEDTVGGTGRLGYRFDPEDGNWGGFGIIDLSGFIVDEKNNVFAGAEIVRFWKKQNDSSSFRIGLGGFYKELPFIFKPDMGEVEFQTIAHAGPEIFIDYRYDVSPKSGVRFEGSYYYSLLKIKTPNEKQVVSSQSYQVGIQGSHLFNSRSTGFLGIAHRFDRILYLPTTSSESSLSNASTTDVNNATLTGNYLQFGLEIGF